MNLLQFLHEGRRREKAQTFLYRSFAAQADSAGNADAVDRLNGLHADEQHHLSRLTARLLEMGEKPEDLSGLPRPTDQLAGWEDRARRAEVDEVAFYEMALADLSDEAGALISEILKSERLHLEHLGGKWMPA